MAPAQDDQTAQWPPGGWGMREAARAMGVSVETLMEKFRKQEPSRRGPYPDPDLHRPGIYRVPLTGVRAEGREAIIDAETLPLVEGGVFRLAKTGSKAGPDRRVCVSVCLPGRTYTPLRRIVMRVTEDAGVIVSHVNGDPLDCRRENLVVRTVGQRVRNARKLTAVRRNAFSSRFKGVCWNKQAKRWRARIIVDGKHRWLGCFGDEIAAAQAYDEAARELFGEHAYLNFPDGIDAYLARVEEDGGDDTRAAA